ncbi:polyisoprenoid diphosphate/phosphate phosphohydrolase PLPP6 [Procambarus clarkii]|uniref:polyisoprenoid diphosphate/phosphate phosphohydrolase PLPP6 n=1 Tax=Procambarus clarkii TaxID=6728 RepID=UPI001E674CC9|nr:phospholipid phosphatase 6-like [Procambarus clarkii]XP_045614456.1 phospholipid phosphatase 6-like [Procambarus clarkii]
MGEKRKVPQLLKSVLEWDSIASEKFVKFVDQKYGPLVKYKGHMKGLEFSCHGIPWLVGTATLIFFITDLFLRQLLVNIFIALIIDIIVIAVAKGITRRRRPEANKKDDMFGQILVDKFSFPSGHATRAVMLSILLPMQYDMFLPLSILVMIWGGAVCISRVLMRRHHLLDIIGGIVIGILEALLVSQIWLSPESAQGFVNFFLDETQAGASYDV